LIQGERNERCPPVDGKIVWPAFVRGRPVWAAFTYSISVTDLSARSSCAVITLDPRCCSARSRDMGQPEIEALPEDSPEAA
jgi:hypothetical protein